MAWRPKRFAPLALSSRYPSKSCSRVKPYLASSGLPMMALPSLSGPGIVPAADELRNARRLRERIYVRQVVEIDDRPGLARGRELEGGGVVRGEHDVLAEYPRLPREDDLGKRAGVRAEAFGGEHLEHEGIGQGLDREEFLETVAEDREGVDELPRVGPDGSARRRDGRAWDARRRWPRVSLLERGKRFSVIVYPFTGGFSSQCSAGAGGSGSPSSTR